MNKFNNKKAKNEKEMFVIAWNCAMMEGRLRNHNQRCP